MRKSLPKTRHSALSSRVASLPAALLAAAAGRPRAAKPNGEAPYVGVPRDDRLAARLRLLEGFLSRTDVADCAAHALKWADRVLGIGQSLCLVRPVGEQSLVVVSSSGLPAATATSFSVSLDDWGNPL